MRLTNKLNIPEAIIRAIKNDPYNNNGSDFTATSLLKPAYKAELQKKHKDEIEEDAESCLYRLYGQVVHGILERANANDLAEKRFFAEIMGFKVSAQLDTLSLENEILSDYKFTTAWGFKSNVEPKPEWVAQLNIQLELLRRNGLDAKGLRIVGLIRDWQIKSAREFLDYPRAPIAVLEIPIWSREKTTNFIEMRIKEHIKDLKEPCSAEERWERPATYAVIKKGQKRAIPGGVQLTIEAAEDVQKKNPGTYIEHRPGESTRCISYCDVNRFCEFYKNLKQGETKNEV